MGELIKTVGDINVKGHNFRIELNAPIECKKGGVVHIQNDNIRLEMSQADFYKMAFIFNLARKNLAIEKEWENE